MIEERLETWKHVLRRGILPLLPTKGLEALAVALETDDPRLLQGATTTPPPLQCVQDFEVEAACLIGYPWWQSGEIGTTVADVEEAFAKACFDCDQAIGEPAGVRWALNHYDDLPRDLMRAEFLPEILRELSLRDEKEGRL